MHVSKPSTNLFILSGKNVSCWLRNNVIPTSCTSLLKIKDVYASKDAIVGRVEIQTLCRLSHQLETQFFSNYFGAGGHMLVYSKNAYFDTNSRPRVPIVGLSVLTSMCDCRSLFLVLFKYRSFCIPQERLPSYFCGAFSLEFILRRLAIKGVYIPCSAF